MTTEMTPVGPSGGVVSSVSATGLFWQENREARRLADRRKEKNLFIMFYFNC
jgi:hypothetical protein